MRAHAAGELERDKRVIIHLYPRTSFIYFCIDVQWLSEEEQRLIDQVTAEVEEEPTGLFRVWQFTPGTRAWLWTVTLKPRLEAYNWTQQRGFGSKQLAYSQKVVIPASI